MKRQRPVGAFYRFADGKKKIEFLSVENLQTAAAASQSDRTEGQICGEGNTDGKNKGFLEGCLPMMRENEPFPRTSDVDLRTTAKYEHLWAAIRGLLAMAVGCGHLSGLACSCSWHGVLQSQLQGKSPPVNILLLCEDIRVEYFQGWIRHAKGCFARCLAKENIAIDLDEGQRHDAEAD
ncbi:hypothetical protein Q8A73_003778 [Channa argus]|nr:hypothetical protein Q8A73_003778 [Channa argus]